MDSAGAFGFIMMSFLLFVVFAGLIYNYNNISSKELTMIKDNFKRFSNTDLKIKLINSYKNSGRVSVIFKNIGTQPYMIKNCFTLFLDDNYFNNFTIFPLDGGYGDYSYIQPGKSAVMVINKDDFNKAKIITCYGGLFYLNKTDWVDTNYTERRSFLVRNPSKYELEEFQVPIDYVPFEENRDLTKGNFYVNLKSYLELDLPFDDYEVKDYGKGNVVNLGLTSSVESEDPTFIDDGIFNTALDFDGVDDLVTVKNSYFLNFSKEVTFSAWIKRDLNGGDTIQNIITYRGWQNALRIVNDGSLNDGKVLFQLNIDGTVYSLYSVRKIDDRWHHITATYDGFVMKIYIDGLLDNSISIQGDKLGLSLTADVYIGAESNLGYHFNGDIDEVQIYSVALSNEEINLVKRGVIPSRRVSFYSVKEADAKSNQFFVKLPYLQNSLQSAELSSINKKRVIYYTLDKNLEDQATFDSVDDKLFAINGSNFQKYDDENYFFEFSGINSLYAVNSSETDFSGKSQFAYTLDFNSYNLSDNRYLVYNDNEYALYIDSNGYLNWALVTSGNNTFTYYLSNLKVDLGENYRVVFSYNGSVVTLSLNGTSESWSYLGAITRLTGFTNPNLYIGADPNNLVTYNFNGTVGQVSFFNGSLSDTERDYLFNSSSDNRLINLDYYYDGSDKVNSNLRDTFTYKKPRLIGYVVNDHYLTAGLGVLSLGDNNVIKIGGTTFNYNFFDDGSITSGLLINTSIAVSNLTEVIALGNGGDTFVPISWAGTEFAYAGFRSTTDVFCVVAPFGDTNVRFYDGATLLGTQFVNNSGGCYDYAVAGKLSISSDLPVLVSYRGSTDTDVFSMIPLRHKVIYGIPSNNFYLTGPNVSQKFLLFKSNGDVYQGSFLNTGYYSLGSNGADGTAPAFKVAGSSFVSAIQQADSDGVETTTFASLYDMGTLFGSTEGIEYLVLVSPYQFANCSIYDQNKNLIKNIYRGTGANGVYKYSFDPNDQTYVVGKWFASCDKPVWGYFEQDLAGDEKNFVSYLQMRQYVFPEVYAFY